MEIELVPEVDPDDPTFRAAEAAIEQAGLADDVAAGRQHERLVACRGARGRRARLGAAGAQYPRCDAGVVEP